MEFSLNWVAIVVIAVVSFMLGHVWFGPLFGKTWMRIHGMDKKSKAEMDKCMEGMGKIIVSEFLVNLLMIIGLACIVQALPQYPGVHLAFLVWLAFLFPMSVSNVIWGGDEKKYMVTKIALATGFRLVIFLIAGYLLTVWK